MSDPRADPLRSLAELTSAMLHGREGFEHRLGEMGGGYPSNGGGGNGSASGGGPTLAAVIATVDERRDDVARAEWSAWERDLRKALEYAGAMWARYQRIVNVRMGVERLTDPGCEPCSQIPCGCDRCSALNAPHWCPTRYSVDVTEPSKRKGGAPTKRTVRLCSACYEFQRPDRAGRLPEHSDVLDHAENRRRRWKVS